MFLQRSPNKDNVVIVGLACNVVYTTVVVYTDNTRYVSEINVETTLFCTKKGVKRMLIYIFIHKF